MGKAQNARLAGPMAVLLASLSSILWGTGDFLGGTLSRRAHPVAVMRTTQGLAGVALIVLVVATGEMGRTAAIPWGAAAGIFGCIGLGSFYAALAQGTMGVVAPVASTGVVIPVGIGLLQGESPSAAQFLGIVITVVGVVLASGPERTAAGGPSPSLRPLALSAVAAVGFGSALVLVARGSEHSVVMTLLVMRVVNTVVCAALMATLLRKVVRTQWSDLPSLAVIATTDASANGAYAIASTMGLVSITAVLASLYPAVTAVLAWRFHGERLRAIQVVGVAATLGGVALLAAG